MKFEKIPGVGTFLEVQDTDGCIHNVKIVSINLCSDADPMATETYIGIGSRVIHVGSPRTEVLDSLRKAAADAHGY